MHHARCSEPSAHPEGTFHISGWSGSQPLFASALLSNLLDTAL
jgi:hypothetical protein